MVMLYVTVLVCFSLNQSGLDRPLALFAVAAVVAEEIAENHAAVVRPSVESVPDSP